MTGVERKGGERRGGERRGGWGVGRDLGLIPSKGIVASYHLNCNKVCQNCQLQQWYKKIYKSYLEAPQGTHLE